jgi:hypothetical protein
MMGKQKSKKRAGRRHARRGKRARKDDMTIIEGDRPTPEREAKHGGFIEDLIPADPANPKNRIHIKVRRARAHVPIEAYFKDGKLGSGKLGESAFAAAERYREAYLHIVLHKDVLSPEILQVGDRTRNIGGAEDNKLKLPLSRRIVNEAREVTTKRQYEVLEATCGHDQWCGDSDRVETLRRGLERMARKWRL